MPKFKYLFVFGVVLAIVGIILIVLGYFMPYRNVGQIDFYYHYLDPLGQFVYQGELYYLADPSHRWTFEGGKQYRVTLINYEMFTERPEGWRGNASDSKIFFWKLPLKYTLTPEKVIPLTTSSTYEFIFNRDTTLCIELATNLPRDQIREQGYYGGDWILTFTIEWTAPGHHDCMLIGVIFLVVGSTVIVISKW